MEQMNPGQAKKYIKQLVQRQEQYLYYLGQLAYKAGEQGKLDDPEMEEAYRTLKDVQTQLAQWEASLAQYKAAKEAAQKPKCPYCGTPVGKGAAFCPSCGKSLVASPAATAAPAAATPPMAAAAAAQPAPPATGKACPGCGSPLDEDAQFCGNCGTRIEAEPAQPPAAATPTPSAPAPSPPVAAEGGKGSQEEMPSPDETVACPSCGYKSSQPEVVFCPECGAKMQEEMPTPDETVACPSCGYNISQPDVLFCPECGQKVRE